MKITTIQILLKYCGIMLFLHPQSLHSQTALEVWDIYYSTVTQVYENGDWNIAISKANEDLRVNPNSINALYFRASAKHALQDYEGAITDFSKVISIDKNNADAFCERGVSKQAIGDHRGAIIDLSNCINLLPKPLVA